MDVENRDLLEEEIRMEFDTLKSMEVGSESYKVTVDGLVKLIDRSNELAKLDFELVKFNSESEFKTNQSRMELEAKNEQSKKELEFKQKQFESDERNRLINSGISIAGIIIPAIITVWGTFKTLKFEKTGSVTTIMGRGFINKLLPKK